MKVFGCQIYSGSMGLILKMLDLKIASRTQIMDRMSEILDAEVAPNSPEEREFLRLQEELTRRLLAHDTK